MTELTSTPEQPFKNDPSAVIRNHLNEAGHPEEISLQTAAAMIRREYAGYEGNKDALGVCMELAHRITNATYTLAALFDSQNADLPSNWRENPEITRTVVSMCGNLELGILKAQQLHLAHSGGGKSIPDRINNVTRLVSDLQQK
ncbi:MAG: hypothetical protein G01um10145_744 [Microgenomates group bacterium Gr01-1014_5]|nr:MAG: hypothetical protein G01um10145_744 [Microgenomates group bacterium Gr01-1014_5]